MEALLLDIRPGDEVIVRRLRSCQRPMRLCCAALGRSCRHRPDTLISTKRRLERLITATHTGDCARAYAGVARHEWDRGCGAAARMAIVEDNAHGLFGRLPAERWAPLRTGHAELS